MNKSTGLNAAGQTDSDQCSICFSPFEERTLGSLEDCLHVFCLECILRWSQTANTCPVDRIRFGFIHQREFPGGAVQKKIKVKVQEKEDEDEEEGNSAAICEECGRSDRGHQLLMCLHCDSRYHMNCLRPSITVDPEGVWICPECVVSSQNTETLGPEEEISDGELMDLLAEVDQVASTSSRLRASTANRPSSFTERRRSARIQSRSGSSPHPRPQMSWHVPKYLLRMSRSAVRTQEAANPRDSSNTPVKLKTRKRRKRAA